MEKESKKREPLPQFLDFIPNEREWSVRIDQAGVKNSSKNLIIGEERKLELRLGPPGEGEDYQIIIKEEKTEQKPSILSLGYFSNNTSTSLSSGAKRGFSDTVKAKPEGYHARLGKELSLRTSVKTEEKQSPEREAAKARASPVTNSSSQTRNATAPVVGWPPVRSFRKNIASSSSKQQSPEPQNRETESKPKIINPKKGLFVKINMDGVPIGRKVDLTAYDSYERLCSAVKELFQGLIEAQKDSSTVESVSTGEENEIFARLLDGTGEYTLVYEDNEGDRVLASDVPWEMFVSTAKRLRMLRSSELSQLPLGATTKRSS